jgi:Flp pilus assembly protein TadD
LAEQIIQEAMQLPQCKADMALLVTSAEVRAQTGQMVLALEQLQSAATRGAVIQSPLPYLTGARLYQQMGQLAVAQEHIAQAQKLDPHYAMTAVDQAQCQRLQGDLTGAEHSLEHAWQCARQVSELREVLSAKYLVKLQQRLAEQWHLSAATANIN